MDLADLGWAIGATTPVVLFGIGWAWTNARRHAVTRIDKAAEDRGLELLPDERDAIVAAAAGRVRAACVGALVGTALIAVLFAIGPGDAELGAAAQYTVAAVALAGAAITESSLVLVRSHRPAGGTLRVAALEARGVGEHVPRRHLVAAAVAVAGAAGVIVVAVERGAFSLLSGTIYAATLALAALLLLVALSRLVRAPSRAPSEHDRAVDDILTTDSARRLAQYVIAVPTLAAITTYAVLTNYFPFSWAMTGLAVIVGLGLLLWWVQLRAEDQVSA